MGLGQVVKWPLTLGILWVSAHQDPAHLRQALFSVKPWSLCPARELEGRLMGPYQAPV